MDLPDWLWQNVLSDSVAEGLMVAAVLAWKYKGKIAAAYCAMLVLLAEILRSSTLPQYQPHTPAVDHSAELDAELEKWVELMQPFTDMAPKIAEVMHRNPDWRSRSAFSRMGELIANSGHRSIESPITRIFREMKRAGHFGSASTYESPTTRIFREMKARDHERWGIMGYRRFNGFIPEYKPVSAWSAVKPSPIIKPHSFISGYKPMNGWQSGIISGLNPPK